MNIRQVGVPVVAIAMLLANANIASGAPEDAVALPLDEFGTAYFETASGATFCYVDEIEVGCQAQFTGTPMQDGVRTNGVLLNADGTVEYLVGDMGELPDVTLAHQNYSVAGWTILASPEGTVFINDATGRGMLVSIDEVHTF